jgi:hypothetical protein
MMQERASELMRVTVMEKERKEMGAMLHGVSFPMGMDEGSVIGVEEVVMISCLGVGIMATEMMAMLVIVCPHAGVSRVLARAAPLHPCSRPMR